MKKQRRQRFSRYGKGIPSIQWPAIQLVVSGFRRRVARRYFCVYEGRRKDRRFSGIRKLRPGSIRLPIKFVTITLSVFSMTRTLLDYSFPLVLLVISSVIIATRIVRFLLKPFRQPKVVFEIIGGIIVGPSLLGRNKKLKAFLFPDNSDFIVKNIGLLGFLCFVFASGVKMDMTLVTKFAKKHIFVLLASVFIPLLIVLGVGFSLRKIISTFLACL